MMAGRSEQACHVLLEKLKQGQVDLHRNLEYLRPKEDAEKKSSRPSRVTHVRSKRGVEDTLCCVKHLPVRRARMEQLSPCTPPSDCPRRKYRKRLSSTPKRSSPPLPHSHPPLSSSSHPPPSSTITIPATTPDISLENALLSHSSHSKTHKQKTSRKRGNKEPISTGTKSKASLKGRTNSVSAASVPPGSSHRSKGDTNGGGDTTGEVFEARSSVSRVVNESTSVRGRYDTGRKKSRGLTVSFVTDENLSKDVTGRGKESGGGSGGGGGVRLCKRRSGEMSFAEEKEKGEHLMRSLNSSRFGALEHSRRQSKPRPPSKTPRLGVSPERPWRVREDQRLGYDWIAGLVEAGSLLEDKEEEWFQEMREFRKVNHSECSRPHPIFLPDTDNNLQDSLSSPPHNLTSSHSTTTGHTHCTQSYVLNDRLFPIAEREGGERGEGGRRCPVCEGKREKENKDTRSIHYIRVSVPRRSVQAPYRLRPHRRRSFDPSDSMALNKHCLAGWNSTKPPSLPPQPTLDLKSNLTTTAHPSLAHPHTSHPSPPTHPSPSGGKKRAGRSGRCAVSRSLLDSSHRAEYSLRSRGHTN